MAVSLVMSRHSAFTLAKANPAVALMAPLSIEAMNKVDGSHGGKLCNNNVKLGLIQLDVSSSSRFFSSRSDGLLEFKRHFLDNDGRDGLVSRGIDHIIHDITASKSVDPFTVHLEVPGYLSLKRTYKKEAITVQVCRHVLDSEEEDSVVPLEIVIKKGWVNQHSLKIFANAHMHKLKIIRGEVTLDGHAKTTMPQFTEEADRSIKKHFIEYLDIRGINARLINKLRYQKDSTLHGKTEKDSGSTLYDKTENDSGSTSHDKTEDFLEWLQSVKKFIKL